MPDPNAALGPAGGDVNSVISSTTRSFASLQIVNAAAHAVLNASLGPIPPVDDPNIDMAAITAAIADVQGKLSTAQQTARTWVNSLGIQIGSTVPTSITAYSSLYGAAADQLKSSIDAAKLLPPDPPGQPGPRASAQRGIVELFQALQGEVQEIKTTVDDCATQLTAYATRLQADHDALVGGTDSIQTLIALDQTEVGNLNTDIDILYAEVDTLNKQLMEAELAVGGGLFVAVVGVGLCLVPGGQVTGGCAIAIGVACVVGGAAEWGVTEQKIKDDQNKILREQSTRSALVQQCIALTALHSTTASLVGQVAQAETALSDLRTFWASMDDMLGLVVENLGMPGALTTFSIDTLWLDASKNNWADLNEMAETLLGIQVPVRVTPAVTIAA